MKPIIAIIGSLLLGLLGACQSTRVNTVWKSPEPAPAKPFEKIVAIVVNASASERRAAEDQLASEIRSAQGIPAYTLVSDDDLKNKDRVKAELQAKSIDGAVIVKLVSTDKQSVYYPPTYSRSYDMYGYRNAELYNPGYSVTTVTIHAEVSIYSVPDARLIWAGNSFTDDPANIKDLIAQVAKGCAAELKKQGLIK